MCGEMAARLPARKAVLVLLGSLAIMLGVELAGRFDGSFIWLVGIAFGWAPDGKHVAYIAGEAQTLGMIGKLTIVNPAKPEDSVTVEHESVMAFFWAPNSKQLAYFVPEIIEATPEPGSSSQEAQRFLVLHLFVADAGNGESRRLATFVPTRDFYNILPYFDQYHQSATIWSPDNNNIVLSFLSQDGTPGIAVAAASGQMEPRVIKEGYLAFWSWK